MHRPVGYVVKCNWEWARAAEKKMGRKSSLLKNIKIAHVKMEGSIEINN